MDLEQSEIKPYLGRSSFQRTLSFGKINFCFELSVLKMDSRTKKTVFSITRCTKKIDGEKVLNFVRTRSWFMVRHLDRLRLGTSKRSQVIEQIS